MPSAKKLIVKFAVATTLAILLPAVITFILAPHSFSLVFLILLLISAGVLVAIFYHYLSPISKISQGAQLFSKGELSHRIRVTSGDELEGIATELNTMASELEGHGDKASGEKELLASEKNRLNLIFSSLNDGILVLDMHRQVMFSNTVAEKLTGFAGAEMLGKKIEELVTVSDRGGVAMDPKIYCPIKLSPETVVTPFTSTDSLVITGKDKATHNAKITSSPIEDNSSNLGCVLVLHDTSAEKELEAIQLDFVSMASHELRTPLTSVTGYLSIFLKENEGKMDAHQTDFLNRILIAAQQLGAIINNLLNVSKVERGAFSMSNGAIEWKELLEKSVNQNQLQAAQKGISLELKTDGTELGQIAGDEIRLTEVLNNLVSNAINYTNSGGSVEVSCKKDGKDLITCVKDTGIGIPPEAVAHLFTKFFRVSGALDKSSNSKGTGLGLYISKSIIDLHHGKIWAESELGKGSTFCFSLPIKS